MDNRPIGIFDSGLGGLTCVREVLDILPHEDIIYFGDTGRVPYGTRSRETIVKYTGQDIRFLRSFDIKFIIIACGTASSAVLPHITQEFDTEICGVVEPAARRAAECTKNGKIAVLGTPRTVSIGKYRDEITKHNPRIQVFQQACPLFVPIVENGHTTDKLAQLVMEEYLPSVKAFGADTVILGCTHYPLLADVIKKYLGSGVALIDSGACAADYVKRQLTRKNMLCGREQRGKTQYFVSDSIEGFEELGGMFLQRELSGQVQKIEIEQY